MYPVLVSLKLFYDEVPPIPSPELEYSDSQNEGICQKSRTCSCAEVQDRRNRSTVSNHGLDFRVILFDDQAVVKFFVEYGSFASGPDREALSKVRQLELLNKLKSHCQCDSDVAKGALVAIPIIIDSKSSMQPVVETGSKQPQATSSLTEFHHVFRTAPLALYLNMNYKYSSARHSALEGGICRLVTKKAPGKRSGRIYIAQRPSVPGYFKIGFTTSKYASKRLQEQGKCFNDLVLLKETTETPLPQRVEQLVLKELALHRRVQDCGICGKQHTEWLQTNLSTIESSIKRWANWSLRQPYQKNRKLQDVWERRAKGRLGKIMSSKKRNITPLEVVNGSNPNWCEQDLVRKLNEYAEAGIDLHNQPPVVEWLELKQSKDSTRC